MNNSVTIKGIEMPVPALFDVNAFQDMVNQLCGVSDESDFIRMANKLLIISKTVSLPEIEYDLNFAILHHDDCKNSRILSVGPDSLRAVKRDIKDAFINVYGINTWLIVDTLLYSE